MTDLSTQNALVLPEKPTDEQLIEAIARRQFMYRAWKEWYAASEEVIVNALELRPGRSVNVPGGTARWYAAHASRTKTMGNDRIIEALTDAADGDTGAVLDLMAQAMTASPWKAGALKNILPPDAYDRLVEVKTRTVLRDGKPAKRKLTSVDTKFIK